MSGKAPTSHQMHVFWYHRLKSPEHFHCSLASHTAGRTERVMSTSPHAEGKWGFHCAQQRSRKENETLCNPNTPQSWEEWKTPLVRKRSHAPRGECEAMAPPPPPLRIGFPGRRPSRERKGEDGNGTDPRRPCSLFLVSISLGFIRNDRLEDAPINCFPALRWHLHRQSKF